MTHRPYPNADRALAQLRRHADEVGPIPMVRPFVLPDSFFVQPSVGPSTMVTEQATALLGFSEFLNRAAGDVHAAAMRAGLAMSRSMASR
ncbi:hypothetical protein K388_05615 [Streptomyces sp. KhCrAH-43]|uniref:hypothetical protein n=1 Tax=unclassified Streptomyces TaxID=2593676 RepID=UPI000371D707|nr:MULTISPECIES: hypothetical protein [unclassified Streptomyces]MYX67330.1 hypothetical protein [Streptomyces sp. SID8373]RAJ53828.1 hypothetical protein K388_05615 [Streptomyces sp. KhCrAH-43]